MKDHHSMRMGSMGILAALVMVGCAASQQSADAAVTPAEVVVPVVVASAPPPPHPAVPVVVAEAITELPDGPGKATTIKVCSGCHAVELVVDKRLSKQEWFDLVQFMGDRGAMGTPAEMQEITDYLAQHFPKS